MTSFGPPGYVTVPLDVDFTPLIEDTEIVMGYHCGKTFAVQRNNLTAKLQPMRPGEVFTFWLGGAFSFAIAAAPGEGIMYKGHGLPGFLIASQSRRQNDYIRIASLDAREYPPGVRMWQVVEAKGNWVKGTWEQ